MSFVQIGNPKACDILVREFLENRAALKQRQVARKLQVQHQGEFFERLQKPVAEAA